MALSGGAISEASIQLTILEQCVAPLVRCAGVNLPLQFSNVSGLKVITGSYTPNNDQLTLLTGLPTATTTTFILLVVDGAMTVRLTTTAGSQTERTTRILLRTMDTGPTYSLQSVTLDGRTTSPLPMAQAVAVNYTLIYAQANIA